MKIFVKFLGIGLGLLLYTLTMQAQNGISFFEGSWTETLEEAKKQRKPIFVDAFTVWCGPCKAMSRNTFRNEQVGEFMNENFVNYKFDMEKGEGINFAQNYQVTAYPTLLYINHKGEVIHKALGYKAPNDFINESRKALDPGKNAALLALEYENGTNDPEVLFNYAMMLKAQKKDFREAAEKYFATQEEKMLFEEQNWEAIEAFTTDMNSREFQLLINKQKKFMKKFGIQPVADKLYSVLKQGTIESAISGNSEKYNAAVQLAMDEIRDAGQTANRLKMTYAEATKQWDEYAAKTLYHFENYLIIHPKELDHAARNFYKHVDDPAKLEKAEEWARQSVAIENEFYNNDTYARVLYKLGKLDEAHRQANKALRLGMVKRENTADIEALVKEIREKLAGR